MTWKDYVATGAATTATAVVGGLGTDVTSQWYNELELPAWQPPGQVIGPVWTALYACIAAATGRGLDLAEPPRRRRIGAILGVNLVLNAAWPWVFFRARRPALGVVVIGALEVTTLALTREVAKTDRRAAAALLPYAGWNLFAMALNAVIAVTNGHGGDR